MSEQEAIKSGHTQHAIISITSHRGTWMLCSVPLYEGIITPADRPQFKLSVMDSQPQLLNGRIEFIPNNWKRRKLWITRNNEYYNIYSLFITNISDIFTRSLAASTTNFGDNPFRTHQIEVCWFLSVHSWVLLQEISSSQKMHFITFCFFYKCQIG